jgi:hypothetical protein
MRAQLNIKYEIYFIGVKHIWLGRDPESSVGLFTIQALTPYAFIIWQRQTLKNYRFCPRRW